MDDGDRLTAVDAGLSGFSARLEDDLARIGHSAADVEAVVLTHSDGDHTGVAPHLRAAGARVLIHRDDEDTLRDPAPKKGDASPARMLANAWRPSLWRVAGHMALIGARPGKVAGAETFSDGDVLDVPGRPRVIHAPGHTPGHCTLLFEGADALFVGDALCTHRLLGADGGPRLMPRFMNVDNRAALESLSAIEDVNVGVVLPGHGAPWRGGPGAAVASARSYGGAG